jgi:hypothetical protein
LFDIRDLPANERIADDIRKAYQKFLISFERGEPHWKLIDVPGAAELREIKWRQETLTS